MIVEQKKSSSDVLRVRADKQFTSSGDTSSVRLLGTRWHAAWTPWHMEYTVVTQQTGAEHLHKGTPGHLHVTYCPHEWFRWASERHSITCPCLISWKQFIPWQPESSLQGTNYPYHREREWGAGWRRSKKERGSWSNVTETLSLFKLVISSL